MVYFFLMMIEHSLENNEDPDQTPRFVVSDLGQ